jgi:hypothetical protein
MLNTWYLSRINLAGLGIGDGWMSPYHNARYGKFLYQVRMFILNIPYIYPDNHVKAADFAV